MTIPSWLRKLRARTGSAWLISLGYIVCFGLIRGVGLFLLTVVWPRAKGRKVAVTVPSSAGRLWVRLGTTDITVFNEIHRRMEYGWNFAAPPRVVVDAGAYTGLSTSYFAAQYPDAQIIAIEPNEQNFELLALNTAWAVNVHTIPAALWADRGSVSLIDPGNGAWAFRLLESEDRSDVIDRGSAEPSATSVPAITITDLIQDYGLERIDLLKLDIEGSEVELFTNSSAWIERVDAICLELHDRFRAGCSRAFYKAVEDFPVELRRGEEVLVVREESNLVPVQS
jgi:FkbM family methyltransferase